LEAGPEEINAMKRVPPSARLKEEIEGLLCGATTDARPGDDDAPMSGFVRQLARLQVSIEAEATAFLGRGHYRRGDRVRASWRNGYRREYVKYYATFAEPDSPVLRESHPSSRVAPQRWWATER
jgi:hypothetical protein